MSDNDRIAPTVTTATIRKVVEAGELMADAAIDPGTWNHQMHGRLWGVAERAGIHNKEKINKLCNEALTILDSRKQLGNVDSAYSIMKGLVEDSIRQTIDFTYSYLPKSARAIAADVSEWLREHYKFTPNVVKGVMRDARKGEDNPSQEQWIANVHAGAEKIAASGNGEINHWFNGTSVLPFLIHYHTLANEHSLPMRDRSRWLNQTLGNVSSPYRYEGHQLDARDLVDARMKTMSAASEGQKEFDKFFDPRPAKPVAPAKPVRDWPSLWGGLHGTYKLYDTPADLDPDEEIHRLLGMAGKSLTSIPKEISNAELVAKLKNALDREYQLKPLTEEQEPMPPTTPAEPSKPGKAEWEAWKLKNYPDIDAIDILRYLSDDIETVITKFSEWPASKTLVDAANAVDAGIASDARRKLAVPPKPTTEFIVGDAAMPGAQITEAPTAPALPSNIIDAASRFAFSPATVYPYERGSYIYNGVRWSIQLHMPGALTFAHQMMDELLATGAITPECFIANQKGPFDPDARHEDIYEIKFTEIKDKPGYMLYYLAGDKETEYPIQVYDGTENKTMLEDALRGAGYKPETFKLGGRIKVAISLDYKKGAVIKGNPNGGRYNDFTHVEIVQAPTAATA